MLLNKEHKYIFFTTMLGEYSIVVSVKYLTVWRFMDNGFGFLHTTHKRTLIVSNKYSIDDKQRKLDSFISLLLCYSEHVSY